MNLALSDISGEHETETREGRVGSNWQLSYNKLILPSCEEVQGYCDGV